MNPITFKAMLHIYIFVIIGADDVIKMGALVCICISLNSINQQ